MSGRGTVWIDPEEFERLLRAGRLTVKVWRWSAALTDSGPGSYVEVPLINLRVVHVEYRHDVEKIGITLAGAGLPDWTPGEFPTGLGGEVSSPIEAGPQEARPGRRLRLEEEP